jgi:hypothetical protein
MYPLFFKMCLLCARRRTKVVFNLFFLGGIGLKRKPIFSFSRKFAIFRLAKILVFAKVSAKYVRFRENFRFRQKLVKKLYQN